MKYFWIIAFAVIFPYTATTQDQTLQDLRFYADVIANAGNPDHRELANERFSKRMDEWINSDRFSEEDLATIEWLSVKSPEDKSFTIVTWQLETKNADAQYFGYLIKDETIYTLSRTTETSDLEFAQMNTEDWVGALYYNIITLEKEGKKFYVLFGYDAYSEYENRKIADVLTFDGNEPIFGAELFKKQEPGERATIKSRLIIDYAGDANVSLNYNPSIGMIVTDHLIARMGRIPGQGATMLPDGSYIGYEWDGEYLTYIKKIYEQTQDTPPFPKPVLNKKDRNIMGQQSTGKKKKRN